VRPIGERLADYKTDADARSAETPSSVASQRGLLVRAFELLFGRGWSRRTRPD